MTMDPGSTDGPPRDGPAESEHVDVSQARIEVARADLYITPGARRAAHRLVWACVVLFIFTILCLLASLLFTNSQVRQVQRNSSTLAAQIRADCSWYRDLASLPVAAPGAGGKPSIVLPRLISDSRTAWHEKGCTGKLPAPDPSFVRWAVFYHLPAS